MEGGSERDSVLVKDAMQYLQHKLYPEGASKNEKRVIRKKAEKLSIRNGELYYKRKDGLQVRYISEKKERSRIVESCHSDPTSGHLGVKKTIARINERFIWPSIIKDVNNFVSMCDACQRSQRKLNTDAPELNPIPVISPWYHIGIDFIGRISPSSHQGNSYILTITDYFTKFVETIPMANKHAAGVANALFKLFMRMGICRVVTSDQGTEFNNSLNQELMKLLNIEYRLTTPYHPQANGLIERFNQTIQNMLVKFIDEKKELWEDYLDTCVYAYNTAKHESTKFTPFELMFSRKAVLPIDIECDGNVIVPSLEKTVQSDAQIDLKKRKALLEHAKANILIAQKRQKKAYDQKHSNPEVFKTGAVVLKKDFTRKKRKGGKLDPKWVGPYKIIANLGHGLYRLQLVGDSARVISRVNGVHLKAYSMPSKVEASSESSSESEDLINPSKAPRLDGTLTSHSPVSPVLSNQLTVSSNAPIDDSFDSENVNCSTPNPDYIKSEVCREQEIVEVLQDISPESLVSKFAAQLPALKDMADHRNEYITAGCKTRNELKYASNAICCLKSSQYEAICNFLVSEFCQGRSMKLFSYTLDVLYPRGLQNVIMEMFDISSKEALQVMFTSIALPHSQVGSGNIWAQKDCNQTDSQIQSSLDQSSDESLVEPQSSDDQHLSLGSMWNTHQEEASSGSTSNGHHKESVKPWLNSHSEESSSESASGTSSHPICMDSYEEKPIVYWAKEYGLHMKDKDIICDGSWLTDKHVSAMNKLLVSAFPAQQGLQDTLLLAWHNKYQSGAKNFVQIINVSKEHWICVSNVLSSPGVVEVYDSLPNFSINSLSVKKQVAAIVKTPDSSFELHHVDVQRQSGASDCALFAMAFAVSLCWGDDPHITNYKQDMLRSHYIDCIEKRTIAKFPIIDRPRRLRHRILKRQEVPVLCICRKPWNRQDNTQGPLVQCQICKEWYHQNCMGIDQQIVDYPSLKYNCNLCIPL